MLCTDTIRAGLPALTTWTEVLVAVDALGNGIATMPVPVELVLAVASRHPAVATDIGTVRFVRAVTNPADLIPDPSAPATIPQVLNGDPVELVLPIRQTTAIAVQVRGMDGVGANPDPVVRVYILHGLTRGCV